MIDPIMVALGATLGGPSRFLLDRWIQENVVRNHPSRIPWGILTVNVLGSLLLGVAVASLSGPWLLLAGTGFCGSFTTFSTFAALTDESWREGWRGTAVVNVAASLVLCVAAFWVAYSVAGSLIG